MCVCVCSVDCSVVFHISSRGFALHVYVQCVCVRMCVRTCAAYMCLFAVFFIPSYSIAQAFATIYVKLNATEERVGNESLLLCYFTILFSCVQPTGSTIAPPSPPVSVKLHVFVLYKTCS